MVVASSIVRRARRITRERARQHPQMRGPYLASIADGRAPRSRAGRTLRKLTGASAKQARALLDERELAQAAALAAAGERAYGEAMNGGGPGTVLPEEGALLYALVRALRPDVVVETGTANGSSSLYLLSALQRNGSGRLISIDLPFVGSDFRPVVAGTSIDQYDASPLPPGREPGWLVPESLRDRWELRLGDALTLLPQVDKAIDVFFHDSLHTREHMLGEFRTAWAKLSAGGLLASHDVFQRRHDALPAFAAEVGRTFRTFRRLGFVRP